MNIYRVFRILRCIIGKFKAECQSLLLLLRVYLERNLLYNFLLRTHKTYKVKPNNEVLFIIETEMDQKIPHT